MACQSLKRLERHRRPHLSPPLKMVLIKSAHIYLKPLLRKKIPLPNVVETHRKDFLVWQIPHTGDRLRLEHMFAQTRSQIPDSDRFVIWACQQRFPVEGKWGDEAGVALVRDNLLDETLRPILFSMIKRLVYGQPRFKILHRKKQVSELQIRRRFAIPHQFVGSSGSGGLTGSFSAIKREWNFQSMGVCTRMRHLLDTWWTNPRVLIRRTLCIYICTYKAFVYQLFHA